MPFPAVEDRARIVSDCRMANDVAVNVIDDFCTRLRSATAQR